MSIASDRIKRLNTADLRHAAGLRFKQRKRLPRPPRILFPDAVERDYVREIMKIDNAMINLVEKILMPQLPRILEAAKADRPSLDAIDIILNDYDYAVELAKLIYAINVKYSGTYTEFEISLLINYIVKSAASGGNVDNIIAGEPFAADLLITKEIKSLITKNPYLINSTDKPAMAEYAVDLAKKTKVVETSAVNISEKKLLEIPEKLNEAVLARKTGTAEGIAEKVLGPTAAKSEPLIARELEAFVAEKAAALPAATESSVIAQGVGRYNYAEKLEQLMSLINSTYADRYTDAELSALVERLGRAVASQNGKQIGKVFRSVLGVDVFAAEPWLAAELRAFVTQNVSLIKTLPSKFFPAIEQKAFNAARQGISWQDLKKDIQKTYGNTNYQAERIARDQIGKFNGQLNMVRQIQLGITRYTWRTSLDARVRHEHKNREGVVYKWDELPPEKRPGQEIMCRCHAEPVIEDLLNF